MDDRAVPELSVYPFTPINSDPTWKHAGFRYVRRRSLPASSSEFCGNETTSILNLASRKRKRDSPSIGLESSETAGSDLVQHARNRGVPQSSRHRLDAFRYKPMSKSYDSWLDGIDTNREVFVDCAEDTTHNEQDDFGSLDEGTSDDEEPYLSQLDVWSTWVEDAVPRQAESYSSNQTQDQNVYDCDFDEFDDNDLEDEDFIQVAEILEETQADTMRDHHDESSVDEEFSSHPRSTQHATSFQHCSQADHKSAVSTSQRSPTYVSEEVSGSSESKSQQGAGSSSVIPFSYRTSHLSPSFQPSRKARLLSQSSSSVRTHGKEEHRTHRSGLSVVGQLTSVEPSPPNVRVYSGIDSRAPNSNPFTEDRANTSATASHEEEDDFLDDDSDDDLCLEASDQFEQLLANNNSACQVPETSSPRKPKLQWNAPIVYSPTSSSTLPSTYRIPCTSPLRGSQTPHNSSPYAQAVYRCSLSSLSSKPAPSSRAGVLHPITGNGQRSQAAKQSRSPVPSNHDLRGVQMNSSHDPTTPPVTPFTGSHSSGSAPAPFVRLSSPPPTPDRSPIHGLQPYPLLRTSFRMAEAIRAAREASNRNIDVVIELYARVNSSHRDPDGRGVRQYFTFADLFCSDRPPFVQGVWDIWKGVELWEKDGGKLLTNEPADSDEPAEHKEKKIVRAIGKMRREQGEVWVMKVLSIFEVGWPDVEYVRGIVCA